MKISRGQKVEAASIKDIFHKFESLFNKFMDWLSVDDSEFEDSPEGKFQETDRKFDILLGDANSWNDKEKILRLNIHSKLTIEDDGMRHVEEKYDLSYPSKGNKSVSDKYEFDLVEKGERWKLPDNYDETFNKKMSALVEKLTGQDSFGEMKEVRSSRDISAVFKKVTANDQTSAELVSITCDIDPSSAIEIISQLQTSPDFIAQLPEEDTSYAISDSDSEIEIETCEPCGQDLSCSLVALLHDSYDFLLTAQYLAWNATGRQADQLDNRCTSYIWTLRSQIDELARYQKQKCGCACDPRNFEYSEKLFGRMINFSDGVEILKIKIQSMLDCLNLYKCNFQDDQGKKMIENFISEWQLQGEYYVNRLLEDY